MDYFGIDASELAGGAAAVAAPVDLAGGAAPASAQPPLEGGRRGRKHHHMNLRSSLHHIWRSGGGEKSGSISKKAMEVMHSAVVDIAKRVAHEAADLRTKAGGRTIMERDIEVAQHRVIPKFDLRGGDAAPAPPLAGGTETAAAPLVGGTETAPATLAGGEEVPAQFEPMTTTLAGGKSLEGGNLEGGDLQGGDLEGGKKKKHHKRTKSKSPHKRHSPKRHSPKRHSPKRHSPKRARKSMMGGESAAAEPVIAGGEVAPAAAVPELTLAGGESAAIEGGEAPAPELQGGKHKKSRKSHTKGEMMSVARVARILRTESRGMRVSSKAAHRLAVVLREVSSAIFSAGRDHMGRTKNSRLMPMHVHGAMRWIRHRIAMRTSIPLR